MVKLVAFFRLFRAFLLGVLFGIVGTGFAIYYGYVDFFIAAHSPQVKELRRDLAEATSHRDSVTRRFEQLASELDQVGKRYEDLGRRFEAIEAGLRGRRQAASKPKPSKRPPTETPETPR